MNARRYPRTLDQAFGPYQRSSQCVIVELPDPHRSADVAVWISLAIGAVAVALVLILN